MTTCRIFVVAIVLPLVAAIACSQNHAKDLDSADDFTISEEHILSTCAKAKAFAEAAKYELATNPNFDTVICNKVSYHVAELRPMNTEPSLTKRKFYVSGPDFAGWFETEIVNVNTLRCEFMEGNFTIIIPFGCEFELDIAPEPMRRIDTP